MGISSVGQSWGGERAIFGGGGGGGSGGAGGAKKVEICTSIYEPYRGDTKFSPIYLIISVPRRLKIHRNYREFHRFLGNKLINRILIRGIYYYII